MAFVTPAGDDRGFVTLLPRTQHLWKWVNAQALREDIAMRKVQKFGIALAAAMAVSIPGTDGVASAAVYTLQWSGVIYQGNALHGLFGPTEDLAGLPILFSVRVDTQTPGSAYEYDENGAITGIGGFGAGSPVIASVTINGITRAVLKDYEAYTPPQNGVFVRNDPFFSSGISAETVNPIGIVAGAIRTQNIQVFDEFGTQNVNIFSDDFDINVRSYETNFVDGDLETAPLSFTFSPIESQVYTFGAFTINDYLFHRTIDGVVTTEYDDYATARFRILSLNVISEAGAVPEPASWLLTILGFGFLGAKMRTRNSTRVALKVA